MWSSSMHQLSSDTHARQTHNSTHSFTNTKGTQKPNSSHHFCFDVITCTLA
eukprot:m.392064 g.392064  ORF g.392064 m.392064 type:complete len:51 (-) comp223280_c0_seq1:8-160(-)